MHASPAQEYRISPATVRCCYYALLGSALIAAVIYFVARFIENRGMAEVALRSSGGALLALVVVVPLRWKVRVDGLGVARRLLFRWDYWTWADLASGRIGKLHPYTLRDPERPWWRRTLRLEFMASEDIQEVMAAINEQYQLPPPNVPDTLTIKYGFRRSVTFDQKGIHLLVAGEPRVFLWHELREIHVIRMDALRRDFKSLRITLPDEEIELMHISHQGGTSPSWRGATAEEVNEFLVRNAPPESICVSLKDEPLKKREHIEKKIGMSKRGDENSKS